jgi:xylan 1,4-beta-xylosidase
MNKRLYLLLLLLAISFQPQPLQGALPNTPSVQKHFLSQSKLADEPIKVNVDWSNVVRKIPQYAYSVNSAANFIPSYSNNATFMRNLKMMTQTKSFVRLHGWGMLGDSPEAWQDSGVWDSQKINQALRPLVDAGHEVIINIPSGPKGENDYQDSIRFAKFCADLVKIVNIDHQLDIKYWEIPNEREAGFVEPGLSVSEMATLLKTASNAMKAVDPSIKVGGPATSWVNIDYIPELVKALYPNIDFISVHTYSGDGTNSIPNAYDIAQNAISDLATLRERVNVATGNDYLPIFLTEYNISYQGSPRIQTHHGAVYDAMMLTGTIKSGADASMYWNIAPYSDMSVLNGDIVEGNAHLFEVFNQSFHGELIKSQSSDSSKIIVYPVKQDVDTGEYAFALINRSADSQVINLDFEHWLPSDLSWYLWDKDNAFNRQATNWTALKQGNFTLSPYSVNLFVSQNKNDSSSGGGALSFHLLLFSLMAFIYRKLLVNLMR